MDKFCKTFVEDIFLKHDSDRSNVLEKRELKNWIRDELKDHKFLNKKLVQKEFDQFFRKVDTNNDGKIDRWELYEYCMNNLTPEWLSINTLNIHSTPNTST